MLSLSIVLTVSSMYFIGVSGLRVLPLSINGMEWNLLETYAGSINRCPVGVADNNV